MNLRTSGTLFMWGSTKYTSLSTFTSATGQENHGIKTDPSWLAPASGDFHLTAGSRAIDSADSGASGEASSDADANPRVDDPSTSNTGGGPRAYDDRGHTSFSRRSRTSRPPPP